MDAKDVIAKLKSELAAVQADGQKAIALNILLTYLAQLESHTGQSLELQKLQSQHSLAEYDAKIKSNLEMFRSIIEAGKEALNAALLVNGGAVVAILSFLGAAVGKGAATSLGLALTKPLLAFGSGVLFGALAFGARYLTQHSFGHERMRLGGALNVFTAVLAVGAYSAFGVGVYIAFVAFKGFFAAAP